MIRFSKALKPSFSSLTKLGKLSTKPFTVHFKQSSSTFKYPLIFSSQYSFSQSIPKQEIHFEQEDFSYKPLTGYQPVLQIIGENNVMSQENILETKRYLDMYSSSNDANSFSQEEASGILGSLYGVGLQLSIMSQTPQAVEYYSHVLLFGKRIESALGVGETYVFNSIGRDLMVLNELSKAQAHLELARKTLEIVQEDNSEIKTLIAQNLVLRGILENARNDQEGALELLLEGNKIIEETPDLDYELLSYELTFLYQLIMEIFEQRGEQTEKVRILKNAVNLFERLFGVDCMQGRYLSNKLAYTLFSQGNLVEALFYAEKYKNIMTKLFGKDSIENLNANLPIVKILLAQQNYTEVSKICKDVENRFEKNPSNAQYSLLHELYWILTTSYVDLNKWDEAEAAFEKVIEYTKYSYGEISNRMGETYCQAANFWTKNPEEIKKTKSLFEKAIDIYKQVGPECTSNESNECNLGLVSACCDYASFLTGVNENEEAIKWAEEGLEKCQKTSIDLYGHFYNALGMAYHRSKKFEKSLINYEKAVLYCEMENNINGNLYLLYLVYYNFSLVHYEMGDLEKAENLSKRSLEECEKVFGYDKQLILKLFNNYIEILKRRGKTAEADEVIKSFQEKFKAWN